MKVAVVYNSLTGNTEKLAKGIYDGINEKIEKKIFKVKEEFNIDEYDVVIAAFWIDRSTANKAMKEFIQSLRNKKVFLAGTMGFFPDSKHGEDCIKNTLSLVDSSCEVIGYFMCNGKIDYKLIEGIQKMKAESPGEKMFKAHMMDEKNLLKYRMLENHTTDLDVQYASDRVNERLSMELAIENL